MDVYQVTLTCAHCKNETRAILSNGVSGAVCNSCGAKVLKAKRFDGVVYVLSHPKVSGVKIGMTRHDVFKRAKQISGTGVPGDFIVMAAFPSINPIKDERKVHDKLSRFRMVKEHFELDAVTAVTKVRTILNREPAFVHKGIEAAVTELREHQRQKTLKGFGATQLDKSSSNSTIDLFSQDKPESRPEEAAENPSSSKGFPANLFS